MGKNRTWQQLGERKRKIGIYWWGVAAYIIFSAGVHWRVYTIPQSTDVIGVLLFKTIVWAFTSWAGVLFLLGRTLSELML